MEFNSPPLLHIAGTLTGEGGLTLYIFLHLTVVYSFTFWKGGWVLAVYISLVGMSFGSFSL